MKRVVVTGASGFIGSRTLAGLVSAGFEVHAVHASAAPARAADDVVTWHQCDLLAQDPAPLFGRIKPTHLLHLAWYAEPGRFWTSAENFRWVAASLALVRAFLDSGGIRVVGAGTCAEYDWSSGIDRLSEDAPRIPATVYGVAKKATAELLAAQARGAGATFAWGRVFHLYGPAEDPRRLIAGTIRSLIRGETARCSSGDQLRDFLHVDDVAGAFVRLVDSAIAGAVNVASGDAVAVRDVVQLIARRLDAESQLALGVIPKQPGEPQSLVADVTRLATELQWHPSRSLEQGLSDTIGWWLDFERARGHATGALGREGASPA
jgi:nucleoside-diphosphate-sugar epimerase